MVVVRLQALLLFLLTWRESHSRRQGLDDVVPVWRALGWHSIAVVVSTNGSKSASTALVRKASSEGISVAMITEDDFASELRKEEGSLFVRTYFVFSAALDLFGDLKACLLSYRRVYSVMAVELESQSEAVDALLKTLDFSSGFFRATIKDRGQIRLARIQVLLQRVN